MFKLHFTLQNSKLYLFEIVQHVFKKSELKFKIYQLILKIFPLLYKIYQLSFKTKNKAE